MRTLEIESPFLAHLWRLGFPCSFWKI